MGRMAVVSVCCEKGTLQVQDFAWGDGEYTLKGRWKGNMVIVPGRQGCPEPHVAFTIVDGIAKSAEACQLFQECAGADSATFIELGGEYILFEPTESGDSGQ